MQNGTTAATLFVAACAGFLAGCVEAGNAAAGTVLVRPTGATSLDPDAGKFDQSRVDPGFTAAVGAYVRKVQEMQAIPESEQAARMPATLDRLALAITAIPMAKRRHRLEAAAREIRVDGGLLGALEMNPHALDHAVEVASAVLMDVAEHPYASSPIVLERARALQDQVSQMRDMEAFRRSTPELVEALRRAAMVLTAIHTSVAWATVP